MKHLRSNDFKKKIRNITASWENKLVFSLVSIYLTWYA